MTVYMVQNNDNIVMAICLTARKANRIVVSVGHHRWHEAWKVVPVVVDEVDKAMLGGCDSYRSMMRKIAERKVKK